MLRFYMYLLENAILFKDFQKKKKFMGLFTVYIFFVKRALFHIRDNCKNCNQKQHIEM